MLVREPLVHVTYYYLREAPGDSPARRHDRHAAFAADVRQIVQGVSGWLSIAPPALPALPAWEGDPPPEAQPLLPPSELQGRFNAAARLSAYALRNMLLLHIAIVRPGEHEHTAWSLLDESLSFVPTAPDWLHTTRYWCGLAPRPPEDLEHERLLPIKTAFGVLCLGQAATPHLLVYSDARTESRAGHFLKSLAVQLDWHTVQARWRFEEYASRAAHSTRSQQVALDRVRESIQGWTSPAESRRLRSLLPFQAELDGLQTAYDDLLADLAATQAAAQEIHALAAGYRLTLMQNGLWDAAPSVWEAQAAGLGQLAGQIEADLRHLDTTLRRLEMLTGGVQTRLVLLHGERERLLIALVLLMGLALLAVLVADTSPARMAVRLLALIAVAGIVWGAWRAWLRARLP